MAFLFILALDSSGYTPVIAGHQARHNGSIHPVQKAINLWTRVQKSWKSPDEGGKPSHPPQVAEEQEQEEQARLVGQETAVIEVLVIHRAHQDWGRCHLPW